MVVSGTLPTKTPVPVPVLMPSFWLSTVPVAASVTTCRRLGVPSDSLPETTVSQASFGVPSAAQTTRRGAVSSAEPAWAASAASCAFGAASFGVVFTPLSTASLALVTPVVAPVASWWTIRSPPSTGRPA